MTSNIQNTYKTTMMLFPPQSHSSCSIYSGSLDRNRFQSHLEIFYHHAATTTTSISCYEVCSTGTGGEGARLLNAHISSSTENVSRYGTA